MVVVNGSCLFKKGTCKSVPWEVQNYKFKTNFMVLSLNGCDMVLGVQWLLALGDIIWNFSSLTMQFMVKGVPCTIHGIAPGSLAATERDLSSRCFASVSQVLGPYTLILSTPTQITLSATKVRGVLVSFKIF